jgi:tol-pal system protein YbgF
MDSTMKNNALVAALAFGLAAAIGTPASAQSREQRQMMADIRILQMQAQEMQNLVTSMSQAVGDALKALNTRLNEQNDATRKAFADQKLVIDTLSNDLRVVREKVDDNNVRVGSLAQEVDSLRQLITAIPRGAPDADTFNPTAASAAGAATGAPSAGASPEQVWNAAMSDYYSGDWELAIIGFNSYLTSFPKSERADDAQFQIGQSYYQEGKYDKSVEAYNVVVRTYPKSELLPEAYFKIGESYRNLKNLDRARTAFEFVIKTFPDSATAALAKQRLEDIKP